MPYYITRTSLESLRQRVEEIQRRLKGEVAREIGRAASLGDLSENAEWEAAIELQGNLKNEVSRIMDKIREASLIEELPVSGEKVTIGTRVTLHDLDRDEEITYEILGEEESDLPNGVISFSAPLARGIMQKEPGDAVAVRLPGGVRNFEIVDVVKIEFP